MSVRITDVAVAIFLKPDGRFLLASRPEGKPYPGYWEFPGGKIEPGESVREALQRELIEELNVTIVTASPWFTFIMRYTHATVRLHCWRVTDWSGDMRGMEGQAFAWQSIDAITVQPTLPGCVPIFNALRLPTHYAITNASEVGVAAYLQYLRGFPAEKARNAAPVLEFSSWIERERHALRGFPKLIQVREKQLSADELTRFARAVADIARSHGSRVVVNGDLALADRIGTGVHLSAAQLSAATARPSTGFVAASTHQRAEIEDAARLGFDAVVLGPVLPTKSHPEAIPMGWEAFRDGVDATPLPVFALGGLQPDDFATAITHGAHGIAMQRGLAANAPVPQRHATGSVARPA